MTVVKKINGISVASVTIQNTASNVSYSNAVSGLTSTNVQTAIDELDGRSVIALSVLYSNGSSGLTATNVQDAIDEILTVPIESQYVIYSNTTSGLTSTDVQSAIDEVSSDLIYTASELPYINTTSGLVATNVQTALDEINGSISGSDQAVDIIYSNTTSGLAATNVQTAIDEVSAIAGTDQAVDIVYSNTTSGLTATNVQTALDEVAATAGSDIAADISYTNTTSGLSAINVQTAIDEVVSDAVTTASELAYVNTTSGLTATNTQDAIDEVLAIAETDIAADISYVNTTSGLTATNVQTAIDEVVSDAVTTASELSYSNTTSGLTATNTQDAIDEVASVSFDDIAPATTEGDIIYRNSTTNTRLGIGTAGQVLTVNAGATAPEWVDGGSGGAATDITYSNTTSGLTATNVQTAIDEVVSSGVTGSYQTNFISGGIISNDGTTPDEIINITAVVCRSSDDTVNISASSGSLQITTNANWASGTAPSLTNASIFVYATASGYILDDVSGSNIIGVKRRIGAFLTDVDGDIIPFIAIENAGGSIETNYTSYIAETTTTHDLTAPVGIPLNIKILCQLGGNRNGTSIVSSYIGEWATISSYYSSGSWDGANAIKDNFPVSASNREITITVQSLSILRNYGYIDERLL